LPASYAQERLWFLDRFEPASAVYNIPFIATIRGAIHRREFTRAVNRLVERHESLRTCFVENAGQPAQAIHEQLDVDVRHIDLGGPDPATAARQLQEACTEATSEPFDLAVAPLFRIVLVSVGGETTIITTMHHIISDGWSIGVFQRELSALYQEELGGRPADLPELPIQYADYAVWQRDGLQGPGLEQRMTYWRKQLDGANTVLEIPGDRPRPLKQTFSGDVHLFELSPEVSAQVKSLSLEHEATPFMTLLSVFAALLYRLTGQRDLLIGTPIAGRRNMDLEHLIGFFVNTLVLRAEVTPELTFVELLSQTKATTLDAYDNQDVPFEKLVLELNPKRALSHSPLIQVLFSLQNIPTLQSLLADRGAADGAAQQLNGHTGTAKFDFALFVSEVGDLLQCSIEYNTDLFSPRTIEEIADCYSCLVEAVVDDPEAEVASYPLMDDARRAAALAAGRGPVHPAPDQSCCHRLFEKVARRTPDVLAVVHATGDDTQQRTYGELNAHANRLARFLVARGVEPGDRIGICMARGVDQIAAVLAIVKAGAAYVPLDPTFPSERLEYMLADSGAKAVLSTTRTRTTLAGAGRLTMVDRLDAELARLDPADLNIESSPDDPLYILYTSGSTGVPKGVAMPHRAIVNLVDWQARSSGADAGAVTLQFASLNFDVASQEIFSALTAGGRLELVDDDVRRDGSRLLGLLAERGVSRLFVPPVALEEIARAAGRKPVALDELREVIVAGDKLTVTDGVREWLAGAAQVRLVNQYGPTETHVVSAHVMEGPASTWPAQPPIGRPIDNVDLFVLDERGEAVPPGVTGELYVGGVSVALGYLNADEQTAERFVENPFADHPGLLYRTGDLCRFVGDLVEFVGRADAQIKLRGFRIEPAEIEHALKRLAGVDDAVVVKRSTPEGEDRLVAYLVMAHTGAIDVALVRSRLGESLPPYMIPTSFVGLDEVPLTATGKVDRRRLPEPVDRHATAEREFSFVAPRSPVERFLAECWCDLLNVNKVGIHDNFFDLGGHSLTATQLVSRVRDQFDLELPLASVFERPTVEQLAVEVVQLRAATEDEDVLAGLLAELESLSEEDSRALLSDDP
jgi:amino acid adenylation domain-containing protein